MQWLTALLAFAVTMLMFAIVVSTLVEMIHRIMNLRAKGLQLMLENLYTRVVLPKLSKAGGNDGKLLTSRQFAALIMENRAATQEGKPPTGIVSGILRRFVDWAVVTNIPVEVFTQKLADNRLVGAADNFTDEVVKDIAQKYEAFGKEVSLYFESRARLLSVIVAFFVAWMFYVHPYKLAATYLKNPEVAEAIANTAADVQADYAVLVERLNKSSAAAGPEAEATTAELKAAIDELKTSIAEAEAQKRAFQDLGAPVGWPEASSKTACGASFGASDCSLTLLGASVPLPSFVNAFWLIVGGLLVGLGAPFWAKMVSSFTASRDVSQRIAAIVAPDAAVAEAVAPTMAREATPVASFKVARAATERNLK